MKVAIRTLDELAVEATRVMAGLAPRAQGATLVTLSGGLGAGKTAFTQTIARAFGVVEPVTSPTFVLEKIYELPKGPFKRLVHIDAYRLNGVEELAPLGFDEVMRDPGNLILLEWPERVEGALPDPTARITFALHPDGSRTLSYGD